MRKNWLSTVSLVAVVVLSACSSTPTTTPVPTPGVTFVPKGTREPVQSAVTATPRPLGAPMLVDHAPLRGEALRLDQPLELQFDQPMDRGSVEKSVAVVDASGAAVNGAFEWTSDAVVRFTPAQPWGRAAQYRVQVGAESRSAKGIGLARPSAFDVIAVGRLAVAQTIPADGAGEVDPSNSITVLFNRPVVSLTSLAQQADLPQPVSFEPAIAGAGRWLNTAVYVFEPSVALKPGTTYRGTVKAGLSDAMGALLDADATFAFTVAPPTVRFTRPAAAAPSVGLREPMRIAFTQKMDHASVEAAFVIEPAAAGTFSWNDADDLRAPEEGEPKPLIVGAMPKAMAVGEVLRWTPSDFYARDTEYAITIRSSARAETGAALPGDFRSTFRTIPVPAVVATEPTAGSIDAETGGFNIRFSAPVSPATILPNLRFTPDVSLTNVYSYYDAYSNQFNLNLTLRPSTVYKINIGGGIVDDYGVAITAPVSYKFTTRALQPFIGFQSDGLVGTYNASVPTVIYAQYRNVTDVSFELVRLKSQQFFEFVGGPNSYDALRAFKPADDQIVRSWKFLSQASLNETGLQKIAPAADEGALAPGIYLLTARADEVTALDPEAPPVRQIMVVTNRHVVLKRGEKNALVWVTDLATGAPVSNLPVSIFGREFAEVGKGVTEAEGETAGQALIDLPAALPLYDSLYAVVDADGPGFGLVWSDASNGISPYNFELPTRYTVEPYTAYLYTDRPIYRPGQMMYFKGIVRREDDARYSIDASINERKPYVTINTPQGQQALSRTVQLSANGAFDGEFALDNAAPSGYYYLQLCIPTTPDVKAATQADCSYASLNFIVSAYRRPEYEVTLSTDKPEYRAGDEFKATLAAKYFFGGNVGNALVHWSLVASDYVFDRYSGSGNYAFGDFDYAVRSYGYGEQIASGEGRTTADGALEIRVPADLSRQRGSARFALEVSVTDANDQSVSARTSTIVHKGDAYFGVAPQRYVGVVGEEFGVDVVAVDWNGAPVGSRAGEVGVYRREWFTTQRESADGYREYTTVPSDTLVTTQTLSTDADGRASVSFTPESGGEYRLVAVGDNAVVGATSIYVSNAGEYVSWRVDNNDRVELKIDKKLYEIGETARVLVPSPFQGAVNALLTVERGNILVRRNIVLNSNSDVLEVPIDETLAPNAFVSVLLSKGADANGPAAFKLGYVQLRVNPKSFALNVSVTPDKAQYGPRDTATYDVVVTDVDGKPVQAELSMALVDKAVLSLTDPNSGKLLDTFYGLRPLSVRTADSLSVNVDRLNAATDKALMSKGGGGGGGDSAEGLFIRTNYKDTAYWAAVVQTDAQGRARVQIPLPDNLTTWVFDARAVTADTKVGEGRNEVISTRPLLIRPVTPRFFVVGDSAVLGAVVNNATDAAVEAEVYLEGTGIVFKGDTLQKISVPARGAARVNWDVAIVDAPAALMTFTVKSGALQDSATPSLATAPGGGIPILNYVAPETVAAAGEIAEKGTRIEAIALPKRLATGHGALDVQVDASLAQAALRAGRALQEYPDESIETVASRLLVQAALPAGDEAAIQRALQRLFNAQRSDGGWGWWADDDSRPYLSAYVLFAVARARQAGFAYDQSSIERVRDYLLPLTAGPANALASQVDANRRAFMLFALGEAGFADSGRLGALYEQRVKLGYYGRALLALAMAKAQPDDARVVTLVDDVQAAVTMSATGAHWQENERDFDNMFGSTRSTSAVLLMLAQLRPNAAVIPNALRWLLIARQGDWWESTHETAWATAALGAWLAKSGEANAQFTWRVTLNDETLLEGDAKSQAEPIAIPAQRLLPDQTNALAFERGAGDGRMYYTVRLRTYLPVEQAQAVDRGIVVARKYERADCAPKPEAPCEAITSARIGENVRVRLTIVAPVDLNYVRVRDPLPAGVEAIDTSLRTSQTQNVDADGPRFGGPWGWGWWWFSRIDIRDDSVSVFASYLPAGSYEYTYLVRPSIAGEFKVMPTAAEEQYFPEVYGTGDGAVFVVGR
ncbi:MAG: Ig-like domain-containing protein [Chloroflexi bacterium]|nr:Ig-like domain-containing protein [Chloroflexota bacterium]